MLFFSSANSLQKACIANIGSFSLIIEVAVHICYLFYRAALARKFKQLFSIKTIVGAVFFFNKAACVWDPYLLKKLQHTLHRK